ncbi:MAG: hypothetical protein HYS86_00145 [Candidatus Chisholmbacteria bacterium]|nr:hypothetical protein [Candidatus Chisholmbacteria bacterium]
MAALQDFMVSRVRSKLLKVFLDKPEEMYYVRELTRLVGEEINAVRRELQRLSIKGMLKSENRGNRVYYFFRKDYLFYPELLALVAKTTGLGGAIVKNKARLGKINFACLSGKFVRHRPREGDEVDLLVVGTVVMPELAALVRAEESRREKEVNYTVMSKDEFDFRKRRRDPFVVGILQNSKVMLLGDEDTLVS